MQPDALSRDTRKAAIAAVEKGQSFESFRKNIKPLLQEKGWRGKKEMADPVTGQTVNAQPGRGRRLKTIRRVNMRSAFQRGQWENTQASALHPYLMYRIGPSAHHREEHRKWDGLILPKDDPWRDSHFPPNGYGCKCYTVAVSEALLRRAAVDDHPRPPRREAERQRPAYAARAPNHQSAAPSKRAIPVCSHHRCPL
jgi:SPP1 gp7 family putative phage head morphogenesis protein